MATTRFPGGISLASEGSTEHYPVGATTESIKLGYLAGTVITGAGTVAAASFGLTTVLSAVGSLAGTATGWAGTASGNPVHVKTNVASGAVVVRVFDNTGAAASNAGTVAIHVQGT